MLRRLAFSDPDYLVRRAAIPPLVHRDPDLGWDLVHGPGLSEAAVAAHHLRLSPDDLHRAATAPHTEVRAMLAGRRDCPARILEHLGLRDRAERVRLRAVTNPRFPAERLADALDDPRTTLRIAVVRNPRFPNEHLDRAARDPDLGVRDAVLDHTGVPALVVARLASDHLAPTGIRLRALRHPRCPMAVIERVCLSDDDKLGAAALDLLRPLGLEVPFAVVAAAVRKPPTGWLCGESDLDMWHGLSVAQLAAIRLLNRAAWADVARLALGALGEDLLVDVLTGHLDDAVHDRRPTVRAAAAAHPEIRADLLDVLSRDEDERVRHCVSRRLLEAAG